MIKNASVFDADVLKCGTAVRVTFKNDSVDGLVREQAPHYIKVRCVDHDGRDCVKFIQIRDVESGSVKLEFLQPAGVGGHPLGDSDSLAIAGAGLADALSTAGQTFTASQVGAMRGHLTKWRDKAAFWEAEAKRLGSTATYKIRERRKAKDEATGE